MADKYIHDYADDFWNVKLQYIKHFVYQAPPIYWNWSWLQKQIYVPQINGTQLSTDYFAIPLRGDAYRGLASANLKLTWH